MTPEIDILNSKPKTILIESRSLKIVKFQGTDVVKSVASFLALR